MDNLWKVRDWLKIPKVFGEGDILTNLRGTPFQGFVTMFSTKEEERLNEGSFYAFEKDLYAFTHVYLA